MGPHDLNMVAFARRHAGLSRLRAERAYLANSARSSKGTKVIHRLFGALDRG